MEIDDITDCYYGNHSTKGVMWPGKINLARDHQPHGKAL